MLATEFDLTGTHRRSCQLFEKPKRDTRPGVIDLLAAAFCRYDSPRLSLGQCSPGNVSNELFRFLREQTL